MPYMRPCTCATTPYEISSIQNHTQRSNTERTGEPATVSRFLVGELRGVKDSAGEENGGLGMSSLSEGLRCERSRVGDVLGISMTVMAALLLLVSLVMRRTS